MTTGIYALFWEANNAIYIGQSIHIEKRFINHMYKMGSGIHYNYKIQNTYNLYGPPKLVVIEESTIDLLNPLEIQWVQEFDSINHGLNISEPGNNCGFGISNPNSQYSKLQVLRVFRILYTTELEIKNIAKICGVNKGLVQDISSGSRHLWLKDKYPYQYRLFLSKKVIRRNNAYLNNTKYTQLSSRVLVLPEIVSPEGIVFTVGNINQFSKLHNLTQSGLSNLINKKISNHKGWILLRK